MSTLSADPQLVIRDALRNLTSLATLPEITSRIISTVEDPRSSAGKLHEIICHDPALVSRILKVVNSSFYGLPGQVASIERAIVLLGLNAIKNIAVAASLGQLFRGVKLCDGYTAKDLWAHCIAVGLTAREVAKALKLTCGEEAFLAGMIHDIGILVELQNWPEQLSLVCTTAKETGGDFCQIERDILGVDHQMVGKALCQHWKFPQSCQLVAGFHHNPSGISEARTPVILVHVADSLCCQGGYGFPLTAANQTMDSAALSEAGVDENLLASVRGRMAETISDTASLFK